MATLTPTNLCCTDYITAVRRQVPIFRSISVSSGVATGANLSIQLRASSAGTYNYTIYLFKTFSHPSYGTTNWTNRTTSSHGYDAWYQYPNNGTYNFTTSYMGNILAQKTTSVTLAATTNTTVNVGALELTDYGKVLSNWSGDVCMGIICSNDDLSWKQSGSSTLTLTYATGTIKYATGGKFVDCEVYYAINGSFVKVQPYYGTGGSFVPLGG